MVSMTIRTGGNVEEQLLALDTAISPAALAGFLGIKVDPYLRTRAGARFAKEGDDAVGQWEPLKQATVHIRESLGFPGSHPINRRTGSLERYIVGNRSLIAQFGSGAYLRAPGNVATGELGAKFKRAQQGDSRAPARPVLGMDEQDLASVLTALALHIITLVH